MDSRLNNIDGNFIHMWKIWRFVGMFPPENHQWLYNTYAIAINLFATVFAPISMFFNIFYLQDIGAIIRNLQSSFLCFASTVKVFIITSKLPALQKAQRIFRSLDERAKLNKDETQYFTGITKQCRYIVLVIEISFFISFLLYGYPSVIKRELIFEGWMTSDGIPSNTLFILASLYQIIPASFQTMQNVANDTYMLVSLNLLRAHSHVLCMRVARIGHDKKKTPEESFSELKLCVNDHRNILRLLEIIKPAISQTVLTQLIATGVILCISVFYYVTFDRGLGQLISTVCYMSCLLFVSFPVCYFGNALMMETDNLTTSIFSNNWMDLPLSFKKCIIIFMQRSQKTNVIYAGGLITITLETFIAIIRLSFSMFTFLDQVSQQVIVNVHANYTKHH